MRGWRPFLLAAACAACMVLVGCASSTPAAVATQVATAGNVRVTPDRGHYGVSQPIGVAVSNVSANNYYAVTGHSACTFLQLQRWDGTSKQWAMVSPCTTNQPAQVLLIRGGMQEPFTLAPTSASDPNTWQPGTYRIALTYSASTDGLTSAQVAYSSSFTTS